MAAPSPRRRDVIATIATAGTATLAGCWQPASDATPDSGTDSGTGDATTDCDDARLTRSRRARIEDEILVGANEYRTTREDVGALTPAADLATVARGHSRDMAARGYFAHTDPDGNTVADRLAAAGLACRGYGEVLARRPREPDKAATTVGAKLVAQWIYSDSHYDVMTADWATHAGVGVHLTGPDHDHWPSQAFATMVVGTDCEAPSTHE